MKIGELAAQAGCETETIRYYEKLGLLPAPARTSSGYRAYQLQHLETLRFIRHCRAFDMSLVTIRQLLEFRANPTQPCLQVNVLIDEQLDQLERQVSQLQQLKLDLQLLRARCQDVQQTGDCEILKNLVQPCANECQSHRS